MMKRFLCLMLAMLVLSGLFGCHYSDSGDILEPVEYFYPRKSASFIYGSVDGVFSAEIREASGHRDDLHYLISMYLRGPQDSNLRSPFPANCKLEEIRIEDDTLHIRFSKEFSTLENMDLILACAALTKTCLSMTDLSYVHISSHAEGKAFSIQMDADTILLADYSAFETQPKAE